MTVQTRVNFLKLDERLYVDVMALEAGMLDVADEVEADGHPVAAEVVRGMWADIWNAIEQAEV